MKKVINVVFYIIVIIISILNIIYGSIFEIKEYNFRKNAKITTANIYQTVNREDGKQVLYFTYRVNGKKYEDLLVLDKCKTNKSYIKIYYNKNNPLEFTEGSINKKGFIFISIGIIFIILTIILLVRGILKRKSNTKEI